MRWAHWLIAISLSLGVAPVSCLIGGQAFAQESDEDRALQRFAFADPSGHHLVLQTDRDIDAYRLTRAICDGGQTRAVTAVDMADTEHTHNLDDEASADKNFHDLAGVVYHVGEPFAPGNGTCLLFDHGAFEELEVDAPIPATEESCDPELVASLSAEAARPVAECGVIGEFDPGGTVQLVVFEPRGSNLLAQVVLVDGERRASYSLAATADSGSAWRVDDGGVIHAEHFDLMFALRQGSLLAVAIAWAGAEGTNYGLYQVRGDDLEIIAEGYRYFTFPED